MNNRRQFIKRVGLLGSSLLALPVFAWVRNQSENGKKKNYMNTVKEITALGFKWDTLDPFLFCVHHEDAYPKGTSEMGVDTKHFEGRHMGEDFIIKDGFRMYHGKQIPGFPGHPHRGFETVTVVREGVVDHADSTGASGRYGNGDVQWMTAGKGVQHSEMFPLVHSDKENPMELFQIWLNLPKKSKMVEPHFKMLWRDKIPVIENLDAKGRKSKVEVIAGTVGSSVAQTPPPDSWAATDSNEVAILNIKLDEGGSYELPAASKGVNRAIYFYEGEQLTINGEAVGKYSRAVVQEDKVLNLTAVNGNASILVLQGKPINEEVMQYGPFVMNSKEEIQQAFDDYHKTQFGGWPWSRRDQVHDKSKLRFADHGNGTVEEKQSL